jgi:hypothetical protein
MNAFKAYAGAIALGLGIASYAELGGPGIDSLQIASDSVMNWVGGSKPVRTAPWRDLYGAHQPRLHRIDARLAALTGESLDVTAVCRNHPRTRNRPREDLRHSPLDCPAHTL